MANQTQEDEYLWRDRKAYIFRSAVVIYRLFPHKNKTHLPERILNIVEDEIDLYKITDKKLLLPLGQRMFGCGTIHIDSRDVSLPSFDMGSIKNPRDVMNLLDECITEQRDRYGIRGRDLYGMPQHHPHDDSDDYDGQDDSDES